MSLTAFDASTLHGFAGSPLYARNRVTPNTDAIARVFSEGGTVAFSSLYDRAVTSWQYSDPGRPQLNPINRPLGNTSTSKQIAPGWNRVSILVWGIDAICNPWVLQRLESYIDDRGRTVKAYNEAREISLSIKLGSAATQESIPTFRQSSITTTVSTDPNRVPLNCVNPSNASSFASPSLLYRFQRTIKVSVFNSSLAPVLFQWVLSGGSASGRWTNNIFHQPSTPANALVPVENWLRGNPSGLNMSNPIRLNGATGNLFDGVTPANTIGTAFVVTGVSADSQYRQLEYTDTVFEAV